MAQREWHFKLEGYVQASTKQEAWERAHVIAARAGYPLVVYSVSSNSAGGPAAGVGVLKGGNKGNE